MKAREKRFFSKEKMGAVIVELQWKHKEDKEWNWTYVSAKNLGKKLEELKNDGWKEEEIKVILD